MTRQPAVGGYLLGGRPLPATPRSPHRARSPEPARGWNRHGVDPGGQMAKLRVQAFSISLDGFGTGEGLTDDEPFGHAGERLHQWMFAALDAAPAATPLDTDLVARASDGIGAEIMGRRKFHVGRGPLPDDWEGFWGDEPPFHTPVLVLTHHPRASLQTAEGRRSTSWTRPPRRPSPPRSRRPEASTCGWVGARRRSGRSSSRPRRRGAPRARADRARPRPAAVGRPGGP